MFQINGYNLPGFGNYASCVTHANGKRPGLKRLRNTNTNTWDENTLPLVNWRDTSKRLELLEAGTPDERWGCMYHRTEVVGYFKDGRVLLDASYNSVSTRTFLDSLSPACIWTTKPIRGHWAYRLPNEQFHRVDRRCDGKWDQAMLLGPDGNVLDPQDWEIKKTVADMPRRRELRAALKPFTTWFDAMTKCTGSLRSVENERHEYREHAVWLAVQNALNGIVDDHDTWRDAVWLTAANRYGGQTKSVVNNSTAESIAEVRAAFFEAVFKEFDGYKDMIRVVPAGEHP